MNDDMTFPAFVGAAQPFNAAQLVTQSTAATPQPGPAGMRLITALGVSIKAKRRAENLSLRDVEAMTGVSISTLSRLERNVDATPDTRIVTALAEWLKMPIGMFLADAEALEPAELSLPDYVAVRLRSDPSLSAEAAFALEQIFRIAYHQMQRK